MNDIERLLTIEAIKTVKANYFYGLDHKDWDLWRREVFTPDASMDVPEALAEPIIGFDNVLAWVTKSSGQQLSVHHGHMPIIEILSDDRATAIWAMEDRLYRTPETAWPDGTTFLHGFGHYHETYVRLAQGWRIKSTRLTRLRVTRSQDERK